jgi:hypothetical protein
VDGSIAAAGPRQSIRRNRGTLDIRFTGRSSSGFQPAMVLTRPRRARCTAAVAPIAPRREVLGGVSCSRTVKASSISQM